MGSEERLEVPLDADGDHDHEQLVNGMGRERRSLLCILPPEIFAMQLAL